MAGTGDEQPFRSKAQCYVCNTDCLLQPPLPMQDEGRNIYTWSIGGSTCYDFSIVGLQMELLGPSTKSFACYAEDEARQQRDVMIHECVEGFPPWLIYEKFPNHIIFTLILRPVQFGIPCEGKRRWTVGVGPRLTLHDGMYSLRKLFRNCDLDSAVFYQAPQKNVDTELWTACRAQFKNPKTTSFASLLAPGQRIRLRRYMRLPRIKALLQAGKTVTMNLNQDPTEYPMLGVLMPRLLRNPLLWNSDAKRWLLGNEYLVSQGIPMYNKILKKSKLKQPLFKHKVTRHAAKQLAGNMMNLPTVGILIMYLLAFLEPA